MDANAQNPAAAREPRHVAIEADLRRSLHDVWTGIVVAWESLRFVLFIFYALLGLIAFWLWIVAGFLLLIRFLVGGVMTAVLWLSEGTTPGPDGKPRNVGEALADSIRAGWRRRHLKYAEISRPLGRVVYETHRAGVRFWHFSFPRKLLVVVLAFFFVVLPLSYVVPRPHYVQLTDDNAVNDYSDGRVVYLIHAVDLVTHGKTREYKNENAPWLGKFNSQGLKNKLTVGRYYKLWVVGLRWYIPQLYPNIISATETDASGRPLAAPSHFIPATTTGS